MAALLNKKTLVPSELQINFIEDLIERKAPVFVFLKNGIKLHGYISAHDDSIIILSGVTDDQMVYKHSVTTVVPQALYSNRPK